jgi:hypothetical protein
VGSLAVVLRSSEFIGSIKEGLKIFCLVSAQLERINPQCRPRFKRYLCPRTITHDVHGLSMSFRQQET